MNARILVVDDEENIVEILRSNLEREGYDVIAAFDGNTAVDLALAESPDLVLLDCMLPGIDGFDVCRQIRNELTVPILMLTAKSEEIDKVLGLELGADDYITKPFSMREVLARVKAQLRRIDLTERQVLSDQEEELKTNMIEVGDLVIDTDAYEVIRNGDHIKLTLREFELVSFLAANAGQVFTREELLEQVWGYQYFGDVRTVDVTVRRTREKLEPDQGQYRYLLTKRGVGYYFGKP